MASDSTSLHSEAALRSFRAVSRPSSPVSRAVSSPSFSPSPSLDIDDIDDIVDPEWEPRTCSDVSNPWYEQQRQSVFQRLALGAVNSGDLKQLQELVSEHGNHLLFKYSDGQVGPQLSLHESAIMHGHFFVADFIRDRLTEMLTIELQGLIVSPPAVTLAAKTAQVKARLHMHLEAGAYLGTAPASTRLMPLHEICSTVWAVVNNVHTHEMVHCIASTLITEAPLTVLCAAPQLPLELAVANPEFSHDLVPLLCSRMGAIILQHPRFAQSERLRHAVEAAIAVLPNTSAQSLLSLLKQVYSEPAPSETEVPEETHAFETWFTRSHRLLILQPLESRMDTQDVHARANEAASRIAELEVMLEGQQRAHEQRVAELMRALDKAQSASDRAAIHKLSGTRSQHQEVVEQRDDIPNPLHGPLPTKRETSSSSCHNVQVEPVGCNEALIASIRKQRCLDFDLEGVSVPPALLESAAAMQQSLGAAVERLASDLYTSRGHFIYELLQNADDNMYEEETEPSIKFAFSGSEEAPYFVSVNNELGMQEKDVRALCDVNRSMKREGQIGRKGVGWKSVFAVSDRPTVLSGPFRFKFDVARLGRLGYVTPEVVKDAEFVEIPREWRTAYQGPPAATVLFLPIHKQGSHGIRQAIHEAGGRLFEDPSWLLFLRQVRRVEWENLSVAASNKVTAERLQIGDKNVILVRHTGGEEDTAEELKYLVHRKAVPVPTELQCSGWSPEEEVAVAVQAVEQAGADESSTELDFEGVSPSVFCFLPVRPVGFRFLLHAPWVLTSNREDWHLEDERNLWLRGIAAAALAETITRFGHLLGARSLDLLDGRRVLDPFWRKLLEQASCLLGDAAIVPVELDREVPENQLLAKPSQVLVPSPDLIRSTKVLVLLQALPVHVWLSHTGKYLAKISHHLSSAAEEAQRLVTLGAEPLMLGRLSQVLNNAKEIPEILGQPRLLNALYDVLAHFLTPNSYKTSSDGGTVSDACLKRTLLVDRVQTIQDMRAFPLDGPSSQLDIVRLSEGNVFLPASSGPWCPGLDSSTCNSLLSHHGIKVFSHRMLQALTSDGRAFIEKMKLREATLEHVAAAVVRTHALHVPDAARSFSLREAYAPKAKDNKEVLGVLWAGIEAVRAAHEQKSESSPSASPSIPVLGEHPLDEHLQDPAGFLGPSLGALFPRLLSHVLWLPCDVSTGDIVLRRPLQTSIPTMFGVKNSGRSLSDSGLPVCSGLPRTVEQVQGLSEELVLDEDQAPPRLLLCSPSHLTAGPDSLHKSLQWEAFLFNLGSKHLNPSFANAGELASQIVSKRLWDSLAMSAGIRWYAMRVFQEFGGQISDLEVPPKFAGHSTHRIQTYFSRSAFEPLIGDGCLPLIDAADVCIPLLEILNIPAIPNVVSLVRAYKSWCARSPPPAHAPTGLLEALQVALDQEEIIGRSVLAEIRRSVFVPGKGTVPTEEAVWSEGNEFGKKLCAFTNTIILSNIYGANLERFFCTWVFVSALPDLNHFVRSLSMIARQDSALRPKISLPFLKEIYENIAETIEGWFRDDMGGLQKLASLRAIFEQMHFIILPQAKGKPWKFLSPSEAFWCVTDDIADLPCSQWALCNIFGKSRTQQLTQRRRSGSDSCNVNLEKFFVEYLLVPRVLSRTDLQRRFNSSSSTRSIPSPADHAESNSSSEDDDDRVQSRDDSSLFLSDLIGEDTSVLGETWTPARGRKRTAGEMTHDDPQAEEAAMRVLVSRCAQRTRNVQPGEISYNAAVPSRERNVVTAREEELALKRTNWTYRGTHLYVLGTAAQLASRGELNNYGLLLQTPRPGSSGCIRLSSELAQRAESFAKRILKPLRDLFDLPPGNLSIAVGPGIGRSGRNLNGLVYLPLPEQPAETQEDRCRWFLEVCRLLAENGSGEGFSGQEVTVALGSRFLPRFLASESQQQ